MVQMVQKSSKCKNGPKLSDNYLDQNGPDFSYAFPILKFQKDTFLGHPVLLYLCFSSFFIILNSYRIDPPPLFSCYWVVCDYPEIITEVTPTRGQKPGEGVWDNSQPRFHSSLPGIVVVLVVTIEIFTAYFWPCQPVVSFLSCFFCDVVLVNKKKVILKLPQNRVPVFTMSQNLSWCMCKLLTV